MCWLLFHDVHEQSWARSHIAATTWPCFQAKIYVDYCIMSLFVVATPLRQRDLNSFSIFSCQWSSITLSRYRCCETKHCRVPSSQMWGIRQHFPAYRGGGREKGGGCCSSCRLYCILLRITKWIYSIAGDPKCTIRCRQLFSWRHFSMNADDYS